jgi:hypothetical protein
MPFQPVAADYSLKGLISPPEAKTLRSLECTETNSASEVIGLALVLRLRSVQWHGMKSILLLCCFAVAFCSETKPAEKHTEAFVGRSAVLPLMLKGKESGELDLTFGPEFLESKWLASQGFTKISYTASPIPKSKDGNGFTISARTNGNKGTELILSCSLGGRSAGMDTVSGGNLSLIRKDGSCVIMVFEGRLTKK